MAVADPGVSLQEVPVKALREPTKHLIGTMLNPPKVIPTDDGLLRDWRGLAILTGLNRDCILAASLSTDPVERVLGMWKEGTVGLLKEYLGQMDRWDIVDDTGQMLVADALEYKKSLERATSSAQEFDEDLDKRILTKDDMLRLDQGLEPQSYHAYLLYADEDVDFALKIVTEMETKYKLKLCLRDRDLVGGHMFEHEAIMKLISERCHRLIVVISPNFLKSEANRFFVTFAQALGIDQRKRKVIPVVYERCTLPPDLNYYFPLDYSRSGNLWNFWEKLHDSIQMPKSHRNGYSGFHQSLSESDVCAVKLTVSKEIVSAPIETVSSNSEKNLLTGSCSNISEGSLLQNKHSTSNPSLLKKSFSGSVENLTRKIMKLYKEVRPESSGRKGRRKKEVGISEC